MKLYEKFAAQIAELIKSKVLQPGQKLPSIRHASHTYQISQSTVFKAYYLLENKGLIVAREKSGYFVQSLLFDELQEPNIKYKKTVINDVNMNDLIFSVFDVVRDNEAVLFGAFYPNIDLFPIARLNRNMNHALGNIEFYKRNYISDMTVGNIDLRRQIVCRYMLNNVNLSIDEIIITNGAMEALNLCLQAVTKPGDIVAVESPTFYAILQILQRLQLKAIEIPTHPTTGIDLNILAETIRTSDIKACCFMTTFQNPTGATLSNEDKKQLYAILHQYQIPAIVDDVYNELYFDAVPPTLLKSFDQDGLIMHCCSFSKSLAPGYRVGYIAAGRFAQKIYQLKLMSTLSTLSTLSTSVPAQMAITHYLQNGGYDRHLRKLRHTLACSQSSMLSAIVKYFPKNIAVTKPKGGYFLWVELNENIDALQLYQKALERGICIVPGAIFSTSQSFHHCIRLNYGQIWTDQLETAIQQLGDLIKSG